MKANDLASANNSLQSQSPLKFLQRKRTNFKQLVCSSFVITNRFPNNVVLLHPRTILVCNDICEVQTQSDSCIYKITGHCSTNVISCYEEPFESAKYHFYIGSNVSSNLQTHDVTTLLCKMYPIPLDVTITCRKLPNVLENSHKWYLTPIFHTLKAMPLCE